MNFTDLFKLKDNPFRMTPSQLDNKIVWAGFKELKKDLEKRIIISMRLSSTSLVLNWGEYGSGKTHSANYFQQERILQELANSCEKTIPFAQKIVLPKGRNPIGDIVVKIIDRLNINKLRDDFEPSFEEMSSYIEASTNSILLQNVLKAIFSRKINGDLIKSYLYGAVTNADLKKEGFRELGIIRKFQMDDDAIQFLAGLFSCLTFNQRVYSSIVLWIDEFEDIRTMNQANIDKTNNFIRELLDHTPNHLLIFTNFTLSPIDGLEDLSRYLSQAVIERVKARIEFKIPDKDQLHIYFKELLKLYRTEEIQDEYFPFTEECVEFVRNELGNVSLRRFNEAFSILLELASIDEITSLSREFAEKNRSEFAGWK